MAGSGISKPGISSSAGCAAAVDAAPGATVRGALVTLVHNCTGVGGVPLAHGDGNGSLLLRGLQQNPSALRQRDGVASSKNSTKASQSCAGTCVPCSAALPRLPFIRNSSAESS